MAKILVIDDDEQLLRMVAMFLQRGGHTPVLQSDPTAGVSMILAEQPDLLILDVMMPEINGHDLCRQIRATEEIADLPILILTARAQPIDRVAALESGADDYMSKPVTPQELLKRVDNLVLTRAPAGAPAGERGLLIALFSMRGGVGRTTLATNLALALRQVGSQETCLIDLSPSIGQVAMQLRLAARNNWANLPPAGELDWPALREHMPVYQTGLRVLPSPEHPQRADQPDQPLTQAVLGHLREQMRFIVVDLPALLNDGVRAVLRNSDLLLHVVTPEVVSIKAALQVAHFLNHAEHVRPKQHAYLLNHPAAGGQLSAATVEKGLKTRLAFTIEYDDRQPHALMQGVPLALSKTESPLPAGIGRMAGVIWKRMAERV